MLNIKREILDNRIMPNKLFKIIDKDNKQFFEIYYLDNGDLYFNSYNLNKKNSTFIINREDLDLYKLFNNLFTDFNCNDIYDSKKIKDVIYNKSLNSIKFNSDNIEDYNTKKQNELIITKDKNYLKIDFINNSSKPFCNIRFNTDRSIYGNLVFLFVGLHTNLNKLYGCYQMDIEEYINIKKLERRTDNEKN